MVVKIIENKKEIIRNSIHHIWKATNGGVRKIVFNDTSRSATIFLSDGTNDTENLDAPGAVLISEETFRKIINDLANLKGKESIIVEDDLDNDGSSHVDELMLDAQTNENDENDTLNFEDDQWTEDSRINDYFKMSKRKEENQNAVIQETNMGSSFEVSERDSTNDNEKAEFLQDGDDLDELAIIPSTPQPSSLKSNTTEIDQVNEIQVVEPHIQDPLLYNSSSSDEISQVNKTQSTKSNAQELLQNDGSPSDEYSNSEEEIDELIFDALASSHIAAEYANDAIERVPSNLTEDSPLPSINEILGQSFIARNINVKTNPSQISNDLKFGKEIERTPESQLNNEHVNNNQEEYREQEYREHLYYLFPPNQLEREQSNSSHSSTSISTVSSQEILTNKTVTSYADANEANNRLEVYQIMPTKIINGF
ncbi:30578_t:CDS:10 [Gigaspora margarita]|uniref:30578_t:CDS:1 n=1 Tax=Gigaspora margarita TaxID=4874 RepID=A0ABM8VY99_GIGMA|nr:30578_t:CDS:10 [Gigaspora margarita]